MTLNFLIPLFPHHLSPPPNPPLQLLNLPLFFLHLPPNLLHSFLNLPANPLLHQLVLLVPVRVAVQLLFVEVDFGEEVGIGEGKMGDLEEELGMMGLEGI